MKTFNKPAIVYQGNKFRLLKKIAPLFPIDLDQKMFIDPFGGSGTMSFNFGKAAMYNDKNEFIAQLVKLVNSRKEDVIKLQNQYITTYSLRSDLDTPESIETFKINYNKFRHYVNFYIDRSTFEYFVGILTLHTFSINNLIRFNKNGDFNASSGHNKKNSSNTNRLANYIPRDPNEVTFCSHDYYTFLSAVVEMVDAKDAFIYLDPPYTGTTAVYNENRLTGWSDTEDKKLFDTLDMLDNLGYKWAMSNTFRAKNGNPKKDIIRWAAQYTVHHLNVNYASFGHSNTGNDEVLVTNYG